MAKKGQKNDDSDENGMTDEQKLAAAAAEASAHNANALGGNQNQDSDEEGKKKPAAKPEKDPNADLIARLDRLEAENKQLKQASQANQPAAKPADNGVDMSTLIFTDTEKAIGILKADIRKELTQSYQAEQAMSKFYSDFYRTNKHLDPEEDDWLVKATLNQNPELFDMPVKQAKAKLGELVNDRMLGFAKRAGAPQKPPIVEGGDNTPLPKPKQKSEDDQPQTLSAMTAARRAARLKR